MVFPVQSVNKEPHALKKQWIPVQAVRVQFAGVVIKYLFGALEQKQKIIIKGKCKTVYINCKY